MNTHENAIIRTVPAVGALNKVPGFDPLKHLQGTVNEKGEKVYKLGLRYKRLWFRLAHPNGRLLLNPLRITDQMAIFEAQVFFQREDPTPASSFTATKTAKETRDYARAAQDEALSVALDNAGFGIQLCDMAQAADGDKPDAVTPVQTAPQQAVKVTETVVPAPKEERQSVSPAPAQNTVGSAAPVQPVQRPAELAATVQTVRQPVEAAPKAEPVEKAAHETAQKPEPMQSAGAAQKTAPAQPEPTPAPMQTAHEPVAAAQAEGQPAEPSMPVQEQAEQPTRANSVVVLDFPAQQSEPEATTPAAADEVAASAEGAAPSYTEDMPVEDITARMTMDEAKALIVDSGTCKGWTMAQVMDKRPSSLKFFISPFCQCGNILKAAATLLLQEQGQQQKAG